MPSIPDAAKKPLTVHDEPIAVKVGGVLLRKVGGEYEVLIIQPRPKNPGYHTVMGLVRGTRKYQNDAGDWVDAPRDGKPIPQGVTWEKPYQTLADELYEEAGLHPAHLSMQTVYEIGTHPFKSQSRPEEKPYRIHWFATVLDEAAQQSMPHTGRPVKSDRIESNYLHDSIRSEWVSMKRLHELAAIPYEDATQDRVHPEYVKVVEEAIQGIRQHEFAEATIETWREPPRIAKTFEEKVKKPTGNAKGSGFQTL